MQCFSPFLWPSPSQPATGGSAANAVNPFRYRGYYYDTDTGLYYLQSRYYNPQWRRFLNADGYVNANGDLIGFNMFAYCSNNPVLLTDYSGTCWLIDKIQRCREWVSDKTYELVCNLWEDIQMYDSKNFDEQKVIDAHYFSSYKGAFSIKLPIGTNAFSFGILFIGDGVTAAVDIKHEYGHYVQFKQKGVINYTKDVAIPSVVCYNLSKYKVLPFDYYGSPWEHEADFAGGVNRNYKQWPMYAPSSNPICREYIYRYSAYLVLRKIKSYF